MKGYCFLSAVPMRAEASDRAEMVNQLLLGDTVEVIDRQGEVFDPNLETAVLQGTEDDGEKGTVCQVLQKGYRMGGVILRSAMVKVVPE